MMVKFDNSFVFWANLVQDYNYIFLWNNDKKKALVTVQKYVQYICGTVLSFVICITVLLVLQIVLGLFRVYFIEFLSESNCDIFSLTET